MIVGRENSLLTGSITSGRASIGGKAARHLPGPVREKKKDGLVKRGQNTNMREKTKLYSKQ